ncbi:MAG: 50S ribosomal protein L23 [Bacteroidetes bacterium]|jgi:large subunit ribosomal protein L23|nr:50S ribosomal protein L23 [Bacteroidota bacterium]HNR19787.1 50S ribosomal protein L23 [Bacteroidia bacterium]HNU34142.1 50S ribosomal protein L23 [Bacteroidia bacterium]
MSVIKKPIITEKMTAMGEKHGRYAFVVDKNANKIEIKKAVKKMYNVNVASVNTINTPGKSLSRFTTTGVLSGHKGKYKKAIITLAKGETIDFYSSI